MIIPLAIIPEIRRWIRKRTEEGTRDRRIRSRVFRFLLRHPGPELIVSWDFDEVSTKRTERERGRERSVAQVNSRDSFESTARNGQRGQAVSWAAAEHGRPARGCFRAVRGQEGRAVATQSD